MPPDQPLPQIHIQPGESRLLRNPGRLCTLLGSCLGITFWVKRLQVGALCHPMLPTLPARKGLQVGKAHARRYVDFTIRDLASQLDALGVSRVETEVKVFGGADVLEMTRSHARATVGMLNREAAERILRAEGYKVCACKVGGDQGMQIQFDTSNGEVLLRRLGRTQAAHSRRSRATSGEAKGWK